MLCDGFDALGCSPIFKSYFLGLIVNKFPRSARENGGLAFVKQNK